MKKLDLIFSELKDTYTDWRVCVVPEKDLYQFAEELYHYVFESKKRLLTVMELTSNFERYYIEKNGKHGNCRTNEYYVFFSVMEFLDHNEENAQRLYETFLEFNDIGVFSTLMDYYYEWLTKEQIEKLMSIARGAFDKFVWEPYENGVPKEKLDLIFSALKDDYAGWEALGVSDGDLYDLAKEIYADIYICKAPLCEIMGIADCFEKKFLDEDGEEKGFYSKSWYVFISMIELLDHNEENAQKLYEIFLDYNDIGLFDTLLIWYDEWLTKEQKEKIISIARGAFDEIIWRHFED